MVEEWTERHAIAFNDALDRVRAGRGASWTPPALPPISAEELIERGLAPRLRAALSARLIPYPPWQGRRYGWDSEDLDVLIRVGRGQR